MEIGNILSNIEEEYFYKILFGIIILLIVFIGLYFINKKMNHKHELKIINTLKKQKSKRIKAQAEYKKAAKQKTVKNITSLIDYIKMLFTLF
jgi:amino acid permease